MLLAAKYCGCRPGQVAYVQLYFAATLFFCKKNMSLSTEKVQPHNDLHCLDVREQQVRTLNQRRGLALLTTFIVDWAVIIINCQRSVHVLMFEW